MPLYIMRHGDAQLQAASDSLRPLTKTGCEEVAAAVSRKLDELMLVDEIWVSPLVRAQQTAQIVNEKLNKPLVTQTWLHPGGSVSQVIESIQATSKTLLLVSHQPLVGILVDTLTGADPGRYRLTTSSIARIDADIYAASCGNLCWLDQNVCVAS